MTDSRGDAATQPLVVVGDVLLDIDVVGTAARLSPEAPVPVIHEPCETFRPGGAALAASLAARGRRPVVLIAPMADDAAAGRLRALLGDRVELVALPWTGTTPVKSRLRAGNHAVARVDTGGRPGRIESVPERAGTAIAEAAAILVADYGHGTTSDARIRTLIADALATIPVIWDPHPRGAPAVPGTTLVTPNEKELFGLVDHPADGSLAGIRRAAAEFADRWRAAAVCVTIGSRGALLFVGQDAPRLATGKAVAGTDTCGAGDSFAAAVAGALADGDLPSEAVTKAVAAASRFVAAGGAAAFDPDEPETGGAEPDLETRLERVRGAGGVVVATGGCFDLLHAGHVATLEAARRLGDCLVVCLNDDASVRRLKGAGRPLQNAADRARVLAGLEVVDAVVTFAEDTPEGALRRLRPHIWVKGGDYSGIELPEQRVLGEWGGVAVTVPYLAGRSTTALVAAAGRHQVAAR